MARATKLRVTPRENADAVLFSTHIMPIKTIFVPEKRVLRPVGFEEQHEMEKENSHRHDARRERLHVASLCRAR